VESDDRIFRRIIDQRDRFYRMAYSYVRNEQDAMDVVQEVACKAFKHIKELRDPEYAETWLFRVTINTSIDFLRKQKHEQAGLPEHDNGAPDSYDKLAVFDTLRPLDDTSRTIVVLHHMEDKNFEQISCIMGKNVNTVKTIYYRAMKALKEQIEKEA
jgi:RNA polymerase sigma-70 factor (ECF subfamily)